MAFDIYGNHLRSGHCEVHPSVHEEYPCSMCIGEKQRHDQQSAFEQVQAHDYHQQQEIARLSELVDWWRGRYNDLVETLTDAMNGKEVNTGDDREYPLSNGAKALIEEISHGNSQ